ncbi:hypothetical protein JCM10212_005538 [Sporobolomyces blumeae]
MTTDGSPPAFGGSGVPPSGSDPFEYLRDLTTARKRYISTLAAERKHIWNARWTWIKVFFLINRYWALIFVNFSAAMVLVSVPWHVCQRTAWLLPIGGMLIVCACSVIMGIRVAAIYNKKPSIVFSLVLLFSAGVAVLAVCASQYRPFQLPPFVQQATGFAGCIVQQKDGAIKIAPGGWIAPLVLDTVVLVLTLSRIVYFKRHAGALGILRRIFETDTFYFAVITASNLCNAILFSLPNASPSLQTFHAFAADCLTSIMCSRLVLALFDPTSRASISTSTPSETRSPSAFKRSPDLDRSPAPPFWSFPPAPTTPAPPQRSSTSKPPKNRNGRSGTGSFALSAGRLEGPIEPATAIEFVEMNSTARIESHRALMSSRPDEVFSEQGEDGGPFVGEAGSQVGGDDGVRHEGYVGGVALKREVVVEDA